MYSKIISTQNLYSSFTKQGKSTVAFILVYTGWRVSIKTVIDTQATSSIDGYVVICLSRGRVIISMKNADS